ncbi:DEAD/DEAH box helicase [Spiroplasma cantharicola]|uniref:Superfamily I DNA/RNA helicase n=1 Tax=Spiroplasma cantharicola TaxID=362837 RepID=A0A0M5KCG6_9MOLU|nr:AAA domain-containing protein [Spiroplasma cantharicola]ALD66581.1 superfamily I DNA/RNA helicase [Spiroplasma cantharicola]
MNLQFKISEKESNYEELKLEIGIKAFNKNNDILCRDIVISKIKKILNSDIESDEFILLKFFELLNEKSLKELMYLNLSTFDTNISNDKNQNSTLRNLHAFERKLKESKDKQGILISGLAFIFKFDEKTKEEFNLLKNSIVIYADFCYEKDENNTMQDVNSDIKLWFDITRVESLDFGYEYVKSLNIKVITNLIDNIEYVEENKNNILKLFENKDDFFTLFKDLSRSDILTGRSDEGLNLRGWHDFIIDFRKHLRDKKKTSSQAKLLSLKDFTLEENSLEKDNLILMIDSKTKIAEGRYKIISSERDDIKTSAVISSLKNFDIQDYIDNKITIINEEISKNLEKVKVNEDKIKILFIDKNKVEIDFEKLEKDKEEHIETTKLASDEHLKIKEEIFNVKKNIKLLEKSIEKTSKNKKSKLNNSLKETETLKELKQDLEVFNSKEKSINLYIKKLDSKLNYIKQEINKVTTELNKINNNLNKWENLNQEANHLILSLEKDVNNFNELKNSVEFSTYNFKSVILKTDPKDDEEKLINFNEIELSSLLKKDYKGKQIWYLSDFDLGLFTKINRYYSAILMLEKGIYRNPYLATSLEYPECIELNKLSLSTEKDISLNLNTKQREAYEMALSSNSLSYLQGPPGTGKTQTIAAITYSISKKNENTLITSFSHEAINNAFDRLREFFRTDPNIIFYKNTYVRDKEEELSTEGYDYKHMYQNFVYAIDNFVLKDFDVQGETDLKIFFDNYKSNEEEVSFVPTFLFEMIKNREYEKYKFEDFNWIYSKSIAKNIEEEIRESLTYGITKEEVLDNKFLFLKRKYDKEIKNFYSLDNNITKFIKMHGEFKTEEVTSINKIIEVILKKINVSSEKIYLNKLKNLSNKFKSKVDNSLNKKEIESFALKALNNELINVIGITTTGKQSISYLNETRNLFIDYPINFEIIDEVSKSTTIEILNTALLADKVMLAGDYRQLPPNLSDIDENTLKKYFQAKHKKDPDEKENESEFKLFKTKIEKLFLFPLFKNHAQKLKGFGDKKAYKFLNVQHRFNKEIMDIVNFVYDDEEQLQLPEVKRKDLIVKLNYDKTYMNAVNIIDTSFISSKFVEYVRDNSKWSNEIRIYPEQVSFDQKISLFNNRMLGSAFNEYNAYCIVELIKKIKQDSSIKANQIGIISVTKSQKVIIRDMLREHINDRKYLNQIKIDTVDNFQGREKDIIILDLVRGKQSFNEERMFKEFKSRNIDFYKSIERLNVAVSRARHKLIIVGAVQEYFRSEVKPLIDNEYGEQIPLDIFNLWFEKVENNEGVIRIWEIQ